MSVASSLSIQSRAPIWPLFAAPFAAGIYYLAIHDAFAHSIVAFLGETSTNDIDLADTASPVWGSHWIYRLFAEFISAGFGTFIAAGLAHGRERAAALTGGCAISLFFVARVAIHLYVWRYMEVSYVAELSRGRAQGNAHWLRRHRARPFHLALVCCLLVRRRADCACCTYLHVRARPRRPVDHCRSHPSRQRNSGGCLGDPGIFRARAS
jgi:hypothetical protein